MMSVPSDATRTEKMASNEVVRQRERGGEDCRKKTAHEGRRPRQLLVIQPACAKSRISYLGHSEAKSGLDHQAESQHSALYNSLWRCSIRYTVQQLTICVQDL